MEQRQYKLSEKERQRARQYYQRKKEERKQYRRNNLKYFAARQREYYRRHKESIKEKMQEKQNANRHFLEEEGLYTDCIICGFPKEKESAIAFHHIDPNVKEYGVSKLLFLSNKDKLLEEARKCVCMCFNCHQLYHNADFEVVKKYNEVIKKKGEKYDVTSSTYSAS